MRARPLPLTIAAVLMALLSLAGLPGPLLPGADQVPAIVIYGGIVLGIAGLVATYGLWTLKGWSLWLTIGISVPGVLSAAPGIAAAPTAGLQAAAAAGVALSAVVIVLVALPDSRRALA